MKTIASSRCAHTSSSLRVFHQGQSLIRLILLLSVILPLLASVPLDAQSGTGTVEGRVQNAVSGEFLGNARVGIAGTGRFVFTDQTGNYRISNVPSGTITLTASYTGFDPQEIPVLVEQGRTVRQDVSLGSDILLLDEFTVAASREADAAALAINEQRYAMNIKNVIAADAFGDVSEGNVGEFIKRLPGVSIDYAAGDAYGIVLRGFDAMFTPINVDGNSIPSASFSATQVSRGNNLEQVSMSNVARVEVVKTPIPSMSADSLGGTVNLVSKSSFERSAPQLTLRGTVQFAGADLSLKKTPGPGARKTRKVRPGYEFSYIMPVNENFGFTLSSMLSDQFGKLLGPVMTYEFAPAQGGSEAAPYLRSVRTTDDPRETKRESYAASIDWRPFEPLTVSVGFRHNVYDLFTAPTRLNFNTGNNPASFGSNFTQGRTNAGSVAHQQIWASKFGNTKQGTLRAKYQQDWWKVEFSGSHARSWNKYRDTDEGFFRGATTRILSPTIRLEGFNGNNLPQLVEVRSGGQPVDWTKLANYQILNVTSAVRDAQDDITTGSLSVRRDFEIARIPGAIQVGGAYRERTVDRGAYTPTWTYLGADGVAANADNAAAPFVDPIYQGVNQKFGVPSNIEWPDLIALYRHYEQHPEQFSLNEPAAFISQVSNSERIKEEITATYIQAELRPLEGRLAMIGGVRFERTQNAGVGLKRDRAAIYQRDGAGNLLRNPNGTPIPKTNNALERAQLEYQERGLKASHAYSDYYPSLNVSFSVMPDLLLRTSYARTLGRPNFANVVPNMDVQEGLAEGDSTGRIVMRNPQLKPWSGDNFDVSVEYYFKASGVASVGRFRKDVKDAFGSQTHIIDDVLLAQFELDPAYRDWDLVTSFNVGSPVRITGTELNYQQRLTFLPDWARGFSAFGNLTLLEIKGPVSNFSSLAKKTGNWGLAYSRSRLGLGLNWNYTGSRTSTMTFAPDAVQYTKSNTTVDLNSEFRLTSKFSIFFNARNLLNEFRYIERFSPNTPDYSRPRLGEDRGVKMSAGVRGTF